MVELPSNVVEAERFIDAMELTGGSIGTNDLVQTVYAVSRDDLEHYAHPVDARSPAVKAMIRQAVATFRERGLEIGICGQAPSDHPDEVPPLPGGVRHLVHLGHPRHAARRAGGGGGGRGRPGRERADQRAPAAANGTAAAISSSAWPLRSRVPPRGKRATNRSTWSERTGSEK